jgi:hypothetical protein
LVLLSSRALPLGQFRLAQLSGPYQPPAAT